MTQSVAVNVQPNDVRQICGKVSDLALQALAVARAVQGMRVPTTAYAQIGNSAATASAQANQAVGQTIQQLSALLRAINSNVVSAANQSAQWDASSGQNLSTLSSAAQPATSALPATPATSALPTTPAVATTPVGSGGTGTQLGTAVRLAGVGQLPEPHSVEHVLNTLSTQSAVPGQSPPPGNVVSSPATFGAWIADPQHQAGLGLTQVGTGPGAYLAMQPGDVVVGAVQGDPIIAFVGDDMNLYNAGPIGPASTLSSVQGVYRPTNPWTMTA